MAMVSLLINAGLTAQIQSGPCVCPRCPSLGLPRSPLKTLSEVLDGNLMPVTVTAQILVQLLQLLTPLTDLPGGSKSQLSAEDEFCKNECLQGLHLTLEESVQRPGGT